MPILTTIDEVKQYAAVSGALNFKSISPMIVAAERRYLKTLLGEDQYTALIDAYNNANKNAANIQGDNLKQLALYAQEAISNLALMLAVPQISVIMSDTGITRNDNDKVKTSFQYQEQNLQKSFANAGLDVFEDMLELLESNPDDFQAWANSSAAVDYKRFLIRSAAQFSKGYQIYRSRLVFGTVRYIMQRIEQFTIKPLLGDAMFNAIKSELDAGDVDDVTQALLDDYLVPAIAMLTLAKALVERTVAVSDMGVTVATEAPDRNKASREPAPAGLKDPMVDQLVADGNQYLTNMMNLIAANPSTYPLYAEPADTETSSLYNVDNQPCKSIFGV